MNKVLLELAEQIKSLSFIRRIIFEGIFLEGQFFVDRGDYSFMINIKNNYMKVILIDMISSKNLDEYGQIIELCRGVSEKNGLLLSLKFEIKKLSSDVYLGFIENILTFTSEVLLLGNWKQLHDIIINRIDKRNSFEEVRRILIMNILTLLDESWLEKFKTVFPNIEGLFIDQINDFNEHEYDISTIKDINNIYQKNVTCDTLNNTIDGIDDKKEQDDIERVMSELNTFNKNSKNNNNKNNNNNNKNNNNNNSKKDNNVKLPHIYTHCQSCYDSSSDSDNDKMISICNCDEVVSDSSDDEEKKSYLSYDSE